MAMQKIGFYALTRFVFVALVIAVAVDFVKLQIPILNTPRAPSPLTHTRKEKGCSI